MAPAAGERRPHPNHLDIDSIEAVEGGLRAYDGALIVVSHDEAFLEGVGIDRRLDLPGWS
jgi:ATPase subunit of ABC transporter with duplicated ATPase domains